MSGKIKARDLIVGWPCGKSTSRFNAWEYAPWPMLYLFSRDVEERLREDFKRELEYHTEQQIVTDRYRRELLNAAIRVQARKHDRA